MKTNNVVENLKATLKKHPNISVGFSRGQLTIWSITVNSLEEAKELLHQIREFCFKAEIGYFVIDEYTVAQKLFWDKCNGFTNKEKPHTYIFSTF